MAKLKKDQVQRFAFDELLAIVKSEKTTPAVKTQALTQLIKLSDMLPEEAKGDELDDFLNDANG